MSRRRLRPRDLSRHEAEVGAEDGADPREFHAKPWASRKQAGRKSRQLCEQVKEALQVALAACGDPVLQSLSVACVEPGPHSGRMRVRLERTADDLDCREATVHAAKAVGRLRSEIAAAINRRYVPELVFEVM